MKTDIILSVIVAAVPFSVYLLATLAVKYITPPKIINRLFKLKP